MTSVSITLLQSLKRALQNLGVPISQVQPPQTAEYGAIPESRVYGGLSSSDILAANELYTDLLKDTSVNPATPIITIIRALGLVIEYEPLLAYIQQKYPEDTPVQHATRLAHFCKIYNCMNKFLSSGAWPPTNYPSTAPPLYKIRGYKSENMVESDIRFLTELMLHAKEPTGDMTSFLTKIRGVYLDQASIPGVNELTVIHNSLKLLLKEDAVAQDFTQFTEEDFDTRYYKADTLDERTLTVLQKGQGVKRFFHYFKGKVATFSPLKFLLDKANTSDFSEFTMGFVQPSIVAHEILTHRLADRNQMHFVFFPSCGSPTDFNKKRDIFARDPASPMTLNDIDWIHFNYEFSETDLCNKYRAESNTFKTVGIFQGYRATYFPHPALLIAVSHGILDAHPHVKTLWPEWFDPADRKDWVERTMLQWETDIRGMPTSTLNEKNLKEAQELFHSYAQREIQRSQEPAPGAATAFQQQTVATSSGIPAMLSRVNMNANRDPNAAYTRFNRNVRQFIKSNTSTIKARRKGFFTGESKNSYRRTLKEQLYKLMRDTGATFSPADALAELPYIYSLATDATIPTSVVYERMKGWVTRYSIRNLSTVGAHFPVSQPVSVVANLFINLTPSSTRADLQRAAAVALQVSQSGERVSDVTSLLADLRTLKDGANHLSAVDYYKTLTALLHEYAGVIAIGRTPAEITEIMTVTAPPSRGFIARLTGASNIKEWTAINKKVLDILAILETSQKDVLTIPSRPAKPANIPTIALPATSPENQPHVNISIKNYRVQNPNVAGASAPAPKYWRILRENGVIKSVTEIPESNIREDVINISPLDFETERAQGGGARKSRSHSRKMRRTKKQSRRSRKQRGGAATSMPLAWYQPGAQFQGTTAMPTGVSLAGSNASWARLALPAQAGGRRRTRRHQGGFHDQQGGFTPSIMGAGFAEVGMRLLPAAAYMGYNQFQSYKKRRTHRRK